MSCANGAPLRTEVRTLSSALEGRCVRDLLFAMHGRDASAVTYRGITLMCVQHAGISCANVAPLRTEVRTLSSALEGRCVRDLLFAMHGRDASAVTYRGITLMHVQHLRQCCTSEN